jgi:hypothetical protein
MLLRVTSDRWGGTLMVLFRGCRCERAEHARPREHCRKTGRRAGEGHGSGGAGAGAGDHVCAEVEARQPRRSRLARTPTPHSVRVMPSTDAVSPSHRATLPGHPWSQRRSIRLECCSLARKHCHPTPHFAFTPPAHTVGPRREHATAPAALVTHPALPRGDLTVVKADAGTRGIYEGLMKRRPGTRPRARSARILLQDSILATRLAVI